MGVEFAYAGEVEEVAQELIQEHHDHLEGIRIEYLFRSKPVVDKGKVKLGVARKITGLNAFLSGYQGHAEDLTEPDDYFVIEIARDIWRGMPDDARKALVDHELEHCKLGENGELALIPHDLEEFNVIVERHGLWRRDIQEFLDAAIGQGSLEELLQEGTLKFIDHPDQEPEQVDPMESPENMKRFLAETSASDVLAWVNGNEGRAQAALAVEEREKGRKGLMKALGNIATSPEPEEGAEPTAAAEMPAPEPASVPEPQEEGEIAVPENPMGDDEEPTGELDPDRLPPEAHPGKTVTEDYDEGTKRETAHVPAEVG